MEKIKLHNRYHSDIWLEHIENDLWYINSKSEEDLSYMRIIYNEDNKSIYAIDPSGGPFLSVGAKIDDYIIKEFYPLLIIILVSDFTHTVIIFNSVVF